tara:strand:+ start:98 stop:865 length:768 start_codon:yes stop_codon:yes gene_type:complete
LVPSEENIIVVSNKCELLLDPFSALTMTYTQDGFNELKEDIKLNGLLVPLVLREGKILDGRHRYKACRELGVKVKAVDIGEVSDDKALDIVISNSINKSTDTDAAKVEAYLMCKAKGIRLKEMHKRFNRLNINYVRKLSFIEKENSAYLQIMLKHNKVRLYNKEFDKVEDYGTINGIWRTLKANKRLETAIVEVVSEPNSFQEYTMDIEEYFDNPSAEQEYWDLYDIAKSGGSNIHPDTLLGKKIAELIKCKYLK